MFKYSSVDGAVDKFQEDMDDYLDIFKEFTGQHDLSPLLQKSLTRFYESIISFCFAVFPIFKRSRISKISCTSPLVWTDVSSVLPNVVDRDTREG